MEYKKLQEYQVTWIIELDATSHQNAADEALAILREAGNDATIFFVANKRNVVKVIEAKEPHQST